MGLALAVCETMRARAYLNRAFREIKCFRLRLTFPGTYFRFGRQLR